MCILRIAWNQWWGRFLIATLVYWVLLYEVKKSFQSNLAFNRAWEKISKPISKIKTYSFKESNERIEYKNKWVAVQWKFRSLKPY